GWDSTLVYVSDHGESLGEGGLYLHGTPAALAPDVQMDIPFLIWRSTPPARGAAAPPAPSNAAPAPAPSAGPATLTSLPRRREGRFSHDHVFHTVMGALGLRSGAYRAEQDVFQHAPREPLVTFSRIGPGLLGYSEPPATRVAVGGLAGGGTGRGLCLFSERPRGPLRRVAWGR
ncbi:MAG: sulfatase-like hydrolase/transferase, partial [Betaproteobacteria bacterium]